MSQRSLTPTKLACRKTSPIAEGKNMAGITRKLHRTKAVLASAACAAFFAAPANAVTITHTANLSTCPLTDTVHGKCVSTQEHGALDFDIVQLDVRCYLTRDGQTVSSRVQDVSITTDMSTETTNLSTSLQYEKHYCAENKSKFRQQAIVGTPIVAGQQDVSDCEWLQDPNGGELN